MKINVKKVAGDSFSVEVPDHATLGDLRAAICTATSYKFNSFTLVLGEDVLDFIDGCPLSQLCVTENVTLTILRESVPTPGLWPRPRPGPAVNVCLLNAAFYNDDFSKVIVAIRMAQTNAPAKDALLIMVTYFHAGEELKKRWTSIFAKERLRGVFKQHLLEEGFLVLFCNMDLLHPIACANVTCCEVPDDFGLGITGVHFGGIMCHLELCIKSDSLCSYRMDIIWTPYLAGSIEGFFISGRTLRGAIGLLHSRAMAEPMAVEGIDFDKAMRIYSSLVDACVMVTHCYDVPGSKVACARWHAYGKVRVVEGKFEEECFIDHVREKASSLASCIQVFPHCFRLRPRRHPGIFPKEHSLALCSPLFSQHQVPQTQCSHGSDVSLGRSSVVATTLRPCPAGFVEPPKGVIKWCAQADLEPSGDAGFDHVCMICIDDEPSFVMSKCGHFGLCNQCRKNVYLVQNNVNKKRTVPRAELNWHKLWQLKVSCPFCRTMTSTIHWKRYTGRVYVC